MSSRNSDGNIPNTNWNDDKLYVNWYNPQNANPNLRARSEVSKKRAMPALFFPSSLSSRPSFWIFLAVAPVIPDKNLFL